MKNIPKRGKEAPGVGELFHKLFDKSFLRFLIVGVINTAVGAAIMFGLYNLAGWPYFPSTLTNMILTSILSYFLNRRFTFQTAQRGWRPAVRFAANIAACYAVAYGLAQPLVRLIFSSVGEKLRDNLAMVAGMGLFTLLNYFGQKFFAFRKGKADEGEEDHASSH